ncbi:endonuclease exonuclease phosphatase domain-containing protein [Cyclospora cayetanensis]|nr:endonuclease exonuclease phosphatase domain-containing protein [Cyclospora cayetanensis]
MYGPHISVLCLNAYLIPPIISWNPYLWAPFWSCKRPQARAEQIGRLAAQFDVVCLQEVWGTNLVGLNSTVLPTHNILPDTQSGSGIPWLGELIDPVRLYTRKTGGLWFAWRLSKCSLLRTERQLFGSDSRVPFSNQNVTVVELDVSNVFRGKRLVLIGTHFSVLGQKPRSHNLDELSRFCKEVVWKQYLHWLARQLAGTAGASGGPNAPPSLVADTAVLLLGDFNLDPIKCPKDYRKLCTLGGCAELRDLFIKENNPNYAAQYTHVSQEGRQEIKRKDGSIQFTGNSLFPWPFQGRVDYMFAVDSLYLKPDEVLSLVDRFPPEEVVGPDFEELDIPILKDGGLVISFDKISCLGMDIVAQRYGEELSDHWPLSARLCLGRPKIRPEALPCPRKEQLLRGDSLCIDSSYAGASQADLIHSLQAERQLPANQLAGWRQSKAPAFLKPSQEVLRLRQQREERRQAAAEAAVAAAQTAAAQTAAAQTAAARAAAAEAAAAAEWERQQQKAQAEMLGRQEEAAQPEGDYSGEAEAYGEEALHEPQPGGPPSQFLQGQRAERKGLPLAAQRADAAMKARRKPLRM